ncbi:MAG TPA: phosphatase PAP2 family protein [Solirubrobacteraceae bacterium]|nr:phosphatase PAP2 family protein [Solirubrobacteraceae bacterium]
MRTLAVGACLALLALTGCGDDPQAAAAKDAATAGNWRTWVLKSGAEVPVPEPSGDAGKKVVAERGELAVEPWLQQAMTLVSRRPKDPVTASRNYGLVGVGMYDAAVAAAAWQAKYDRPGYPSTQAAIAAAGSRVIAYAFPEYPAAQLDADADESARALVAAGADQASVDAGLELGRMVAEHVIAVGKADGSDREWHGSLPKAKGSWRPPPGSAARPVSPLGGTWRTWVLKSGDEVRPPPPPAYDSPEFRAEARKVMEVRTNLTDEQKRIARFWAGGEGTELPAGRWIKVTLAYLRQKPRLSDVRAARVFALLTVAMADGGVAAWDAKYAYWVTRPINAIRDLGLDRHWTSYLDTPFFPAYVSGHAAYSGAAAEVLGFLFPEDAALWYDRAKEAAASRVYGGIHYWMDGKYGLRVGEEIGKRVVARARSDGSA